MKTPLVLLHGWGVNSQIWEEILPALSESFELHVLDLPGYGNDTRYAGSFTRTAWLSACCLRHRTKRIGSPGRWERRSQCKLPCNTRSDF